WQPRSQGITLDRVFTLAYAEPPSGVVMYAGGQPASLFKSLDYGQSWQELPAFTNVPDVDKWMFPAPPHIAHSNALAFDPRDHNVIYAGVEQGALLKTTDGGATWRDLPDFSKPDDSQYRDVHQIFVRPSNPDELYMTVGV